MGLSSILRRYRHDDLLTNRCIVAIYDELLSTKETKAAAVSFLNRRMSESDIRTVVASLTESDRSTFENTYLWWREQTYALSHPAFAQECSGDEEGTHSPQIDIYTGVNRAATEKYEIEIEQLEKCCNQLRLQNEELGQTIADRDREIAGQRGAYSILEKSEKELERELDLLKTEYQKAVSGFDSKLAEETARYVEQIKELELKLSNALEQRAEVANQLAPIEKLLPNARRLVQDVLQISMDSQVTDAEQRLFLNLSAIPNDSASQTKIRNWATAINESVDVISGDDISILNGLRSRIEKYTHEKISHFRLTWSMIGDSYNFSMHDAPSGDGGSQIVAVISPLVLELPSNAVIRKADVKLG